MAVRSQRSWRRYAPARPRLERATSVVALSASRPLPSSRRHVACLAVATWGTFDTTTRWRWHDMAGSKTQAKGKKNKAVGSVKKEVGRVTKKRSLQEKGSMQKAKGSVQDAAGKTTRKVTAKKK